MHSLLKTFYDEKIDMTSLFINRNIVGSMSFNFLSYPLV